MIYYDDFYNNSSCHAMNVLTTTTGSTTNQKAFSLHQNSFTTTVYIYIYICCEQKHIDIIYTFMYKNSYFNTKSCIYYHYLYFKVLKIS